MSAGAWLTGLLLGLLCRCRRRHGCFGHRAAPRAPPTTIDHPWHYSATRLMRHMGTYSPDEMNGLHWRWHQRAALCVCAAMQRHNIWTIAGSPGSQGHASGHWRPRSQEVSEPPRQLAGHDSPRRHKGPPPGVGSPSGTHGSPFRPFAPRRDQGSPHTPGVKGGTPASQTPDGHQEARNPNESRHRSRVPPPRRGELSSTRVRTGAVQPQTTRWPRQASPTADPRRPSKRPRSERTHIPTIPTPAKRARQAALHTCPQQATDGASSSSAVSLPASPAGPPLGGRDTADTRPRGPAAEEQRGQRVDG